jgi:pimeloyl-ACP methyl ester carboxylesterase
MEHVTSKDGTRIAFDRTGEGPALVLVNGAFNNREMVAEKAAGLGEYFTAVSYDRRGRGDSGDTLPYAVEREIEDLTAVIEAVGGSAYVYGMSSGGALSLVAAAAGAPITGLAVFEPPYRVAGAPPAPDRYLERMTEFGAAGRSADAARLFIVEAVGMPVEEFDGLVRSPMWPTFEAMAHTLAYDAIVLGDSAVPEELLARVPVPTIAFASSASPEWLHGGAQATGKLVPGAEYRQVDGVFHDAPPEIVGPILTEFFAAKR